MALELGRKTIDLPLRDITSLEEAKKILREWKRILEDAIRGSAGDITNVFEETNESITVIDDRVTVLEGAGGGITIRQTEISSRASGNYDISCPNDIEVILLTGASHSGGTMNLILPPVASNQDKIVIVKACLIDIGAGSGGGIVVKPSSGDKRDFSVDTGTEFNASGTSVETQTYLSVDGSWITVARYS